MKKIKFSAVFYISLIGLLLRFISLNQSFWLDEATSATVATRMSVSQIFNFSKGDFHPTLYYLLLSFWSKLFGQSEVILRVPSVLFGVGLVIIVYFFVKKHFNKLTADLASLFVAVNPLLVYYSQEARMYMMAVFLVSLCVFIYFFARNSKKPTAWLLFSISFALVLFTDYVSAFILIPIALDAYRLKRTKLFLLSLVPVLGLFVLYSPVFLSQVGSGASVQGSLWWYSLGVSTAKSILLVPVKFVLGRISFSEPWYLLVVTVSLSLVAYLLNIVRKTPKLGFLRLWLLLPLLAGALLGLVVPVFVYFRFIFVLPAFLVLLAAGLLAVREKLFLPLLVIIVAGQMFFVARYLGSSSFQREDWRGFSKKVIESEAQAVIFPANSQMEAYRYYETNIPAETINELSGSEGAIWLVRYVQDITDPKDLVRSKVEELGYVKVEEVNYNGVVAFKYTKKKF